VSAAVRVAVLSDVHGNLPALQAVLEDIDRRGHFDAVVVDGDHCLNGPDPSACLDLICERATHVTQGNTDRDVVDEGAHDPDLGEKKRASIAWTREQLGRERIAALSGLPFEARFEAPDGTTLLVVHANPLDLDRHIFPDMDDAALQVLVGHVQAQVLAFGHLHIPFTRRYADLHLVNIAACGLPRDGDRRAVWGAFHWVPDAGWRITTYRVAYDYGATVLRILDSGMPHPERRIRDLLRARYE
jgi:predicted phosphodiesterase